MSTSTLLFHYTENVLQNLQMLFEISNSLTYRVLLDRYTTYFSYHLQQTTTYFTHKISRNNIDFIAMSNSHQVTVRSLSFPFPSHPKQKKVTCGFFFAEYFSFIHGERGREFIDINGRLRKNIYLKTITKR